MTKHSVNCISGFALLILLWALACASAIGGQTNINVGTTANDGTGDSVRTAFIKANTNFTELYSAVNAGTNSGEYYLDDRADGAAGRGTQGDPYDASTRAKFDSLMTNMPAGATIYLQPGTYLTYGARGWRLREGQSLIGLGGPGAVSIRDSGGSTNTAHYTFDTGDTAKNHVKVRNLTLDGGWAQAGVTAGSRSLMRLFGTGVEVSGCVFTNWGSADATETFAGVIGGNGVLVAGNQFWAGTSTNDSILTIGLGIDDWTNTYSSGWVVNNKVFGGTTRSGKIGITIAGNSSGVFVANNYVENCAAAFRTGDQTTNAGPVWVVANFATNNLYSLAIDRRYAPMFMHDWIIAQNVFSITNWNSTDPIQIYTQYPLGGTPGGVSNIFILDNILGTMHTGTPSYSGGIVIKNATNVTVRGTRIDERLDNDYTGTAGWVGYNNTRLDGATLIADLPQDLRLYNLTAQDNILQNWTVFGTAFASTNPMVRKITSSRPYLGLRHGDDSGWADLALGNAYIQTNLVVAGDGDITGSLEVTNGITSYGNITAAANVLVGNGYGLLLGDDASLYSPGEGIIQLRGENGANGFSQLWFGTNGVNTTAGFYVNSPGTVSRTMTVVDGTTNYIDLAAKDIYASGQVIGSQGVIADEEYFLGLNLRSKWASGADGRMNLLNWGGTGGTNKVTLGIENGNFPAWESITTNDPGFTLTSGTVGDTNLLRVRVARAQVLDKDSRTISLGGTGMATTNGQPLVVDANGFVTSTNELDMDTLTVETLLTEGLSITNESLTQSYSFPPTNPPTGVALALQFTTNGTSGNATSHWATIPGGGDVTAGNVLTNEAPLLGGGSTNLYTTNNPGFHAAVGLAIGTNVQAYDADLDDMADGSLTGSKVGTGIDGGNITTGTVADARIDAALARDSEVSAAYQPLDTDLTDLADGSLTGSKVGTGIDGGNITTGTVADARVDAALARDSEVSAAYQPLDTDLTDLADGSLTGSKVGTGVSADNVTSGTIALARLADDSTAGRPLVSGGGASDPAYANELNLANINTGTLTVTNNINVGHSDASTWTGVDFAIDGGLTMTLTGDKTFSAADTNLAAVLEVSILILPNGANRNVTINSAWHKPLGEASDTFTVTNGTSALLSLTCYGSYSSNVWCALKRFE